MNKFLLILFCVVMGASVSQAQTQSVAIDNSSAASPPQKTKKAKSKKSKKAKKTGAASTITFDRGSEESASERNARLQRECKGRANAGVCQGYTEQPQTFFP